MGLNSDAGKLKSGKNHAKLPPAQTVSDPASKRELASPANQQPNFIARHSVAMFFVLATALGTGILALVVGEYLPPGLAITSMLSASIAGIVVTAWEDGKPGLRLMLNRLLIWRASTGYWVFAVLFLAVLFPLGSLVNPLFGGDPFQFRAQEGTFPVLLMFAVFFLAAGIGQELGWAGFLIPRLQSRYNALTSSIIRAVLGGLWHLPLFLFSIRDLPSLAGFPYGGWIAQKGFLLAYTTSVVLLMVPWSIFFTWIFNSTRGSILLVAVLHASEIWVAFWMTRSGIDPKNLDNYWGYGAFMFAASILVVLYAGSKHLSRKQERIVHGPPAHQQER